MSNNYTASAPFPQEMTATATRTRTEKECRVVTPKPFGNQETYDCDCIDATTAVFTTVLDVEIERLDIRSLRHQLKEDFSCPLTTNPTHVFGCDISVFCNQQDRLDSDSSCDLSELAAKVTPAPVSDCIWFDLDSEDDTDEKLLMPLLDAFLSSGHSRASSGSDMSISTVDTHSTASRNFEECSSSFPSIDNAMDSVTPFYAAAPLEIIAQQAVDEDDEGLKLEFTQTYTEPISNIQNDSLYRMEQAICFDGEDEVDAIDYNILT